MTDNTVYKETVLTRSSTFAAATAQSVNCFTRGAQILTENGIVNIEDLEAGMMIVTRDFGLKPVKKLLSVDVAVTNENAPIRFEKGVIGNTETLTVSPQHRIFLSSHIAELTMGEANILIPAKHFIGIEGVSKVSMDTVEYFHIVFDKHQLVQANGVWSESFHLTHINIQTYDQDTRNELLAFFPHLSNGTAYESDLYYPTIHSHQAKVILKGENL